MKVLYQNLNYLNLINIFRKLFNHIADTQSGSYSDDLLIWRKRIFTSFFLSAIFVAAFTYIQNMMIAFQSGQWLHLTIYTIVYLLAITVTVLRWIPFKVRAWAGLLIFFGLAITSLISLGPVGSGRMFLFAFSILASLLLGLRAGIFALCFNIFTIFTVGWIFSTGQLHWPHIIDYSPKKWFASSYTFFFINTVVTLSLGVLVASLERNLKKEQLLAKELKASNEQLRKENAERKLAEASLRKSEERFRIVSEITSDFSYSYGVESDKKLALEWITDAIVRITGFDSTALSSTAGWRDIIYPSDKSIRDQHIQKLLSGQSSTAEYRILSKAGQIRWLLDQGYPVLNKSSKKIRKIIGAVQDITQRKQAIAALEESEKKYRLLIANADDAIFIAQDQKMKFPNPKTLKLFGCSEDYLIKTPFVEFIHPEDRQKVLTRHLSRLKGKKPPSTYTFRVINKSGKKIWTQLNTALITWEGRPATLNFLRDITKQKRLEFQLQQAQKMEAIGTLAGGVAHDLNNILSGMINYPELLLLDLPQDSSFRQSLEAIKESGLKAAAVVQDLLTLARRGVSTSEVINLNQTIKDYLGSPEHKKILSYHPNVDVHCHLENDLFNILGSPVHLSKSIMNLVSNAAEAMPGGGSINISTGFRYVEKPIIGFETIEEGEYAALTVSDEGTGISSNEIKKIFEPFYTKKVMGRSGTGLGMAVVWGTVKDHNGFIDVQSTLGKGTSFIIYFPITKKEIKSHAENLKIEDYIGNGETILVVDDAHSQREIATSMLNKIGYKAESVASGEEAIDYLKSKSIDILLLDMIMDPGMNGLETFERIREFKPGQKAVIASGFSNPEQIKEAQRIGASTYLKKPYSLENIGLAIRKELTN